MVQHFVSIILPERNEANHICECIESIIAQTYPRDSLEVLIVDGMSTDGTKQILKRYCNKYPFIRLLDNTKKIVPRALNMGIKAAKGDIILRMDAHTHYHKDYVLKCVEALKKTGAANVGGPIVTLPGSDTLVAKAISLATSNSFGVGNSKFRTADKAQYVDTLAFGAFRRQIFEKVGLFNEKLGRNQDIEFNSRIVRGGGKIYLSPEIKSYYYNQSTLKGLWRQNSRNGMWNIFTLSVNKHALSLRHLIPLFFTLSLLCCLPLSIISSLFLLIFSFIVSVYLITSMAVSLKIALKEGYKMIGALPIAFAVLHFSYGFGCLWGLIRLRNFKESL